MLYRLFDTVRVTRLNSAVREVSGTDSVVRQPRVGDEGAVVHLLGERYLVECVDHEGLTPWLTDFAEDELELISRPPGTP